MKGVTRTIGLWLLAAGLAAAQVVVQGVPESDPALEMAAGELRAALSKAGGGRVVLEGKSLAPELEGFEIAPAEGGLRITSQGAGLIYGTFRLAEIVRRDGFTPSLHLRESPAFAERMFSFEGGLLNLPDEGFYWRQAPFVNPEVLRRETDGARQAMRMAVRHGFNSITFLNLNLEDYVNYDRLGNGFEVYAADSLHRQRSAVFCRALRELAGYARQWRLRLYIQIYDLSFPDHLDGSRLADDSEHTWRIVDAKLSEMLERTGVDGIVVTATEPSPRLNYRGFQLWKTPEGAGRMAQRYQDIVVKKNRRRMIFRTWRVANTMDTFERVLSAAPDPQIVYDAKHTDGDFFLCVGGNRLLYGGAPARRPFMATFDVFREFDGWGRTIFYPAFWAERFRNARRAGVVAVNAWGHWIPGCIYPGVWVGRLDEYDFMRRGQPPVLATLYLFSRLAWNPDTPVEQITSDWTRLNFGAQAAAAGKALQLSERLWGATYIGPHPYSQTAFKWTMLFRPSPTPPAPAGADKWTVDTVRQSNRQALEMARQLHAAASAIDPGKTPNPEAAREFRRAADLTLLFFRTFAPWRELVFRTWWAGPDMPQQDRQAILELADEVRRLLPEWRTYPSEARDWLVLDDTLARDLGWTGHASVAGWLDRWKAQFEKR